MSLNRRMLLPIAATLVLAAAVTAAPSLAAKQGWKPCEPYFAEFA